MVYVGTYTQKSSKGIVLMDFDARTGSLTSKGTAAETPSPSFLAFHPTGKYVYAVNELASYGGSATGSVTAFKRDTASGVLTKLNERATQGTYPCHITIDKAGKHILLANYGTGTAAVLPIGKDGSLGEPTCVVRHEGTGPNKARQEGPHAHSINLDPANRFAFVCDLGIDKVMVYAYDRAKGMLTPNTPPFASVEPGAGARHLAFHPNGKALYVINELDSTITGFHYTPSIGTLATINTARTLPAGFTGDSTTAEVAVHPSGKFLYGSNRGHDSLVVCVLDEGGRMKVVGHVPTGGKTPRNFVIDPSGKWLLAANQDSDTVNVFAIDAETGMLTPTEHSATVSMPVCVRFAP